MAEVLHAEGRNTEGVRHEGGRLVDGASGQFGVSDKRRAELARMEQEAGVQHEAADESVPSRPAKHPAETASERNAEIASHPGAPRPGDKH